MDTGLSASDVALMSRDGGYGFGGDGYGGMFGLLVLLGIMNGGFGGWGNGRGDFATTQDVNNSQQFAQLLDGNRDIIAQGNMNAQNILGAITQSEYEGIAVTKDAQYQLADRLAGIAVTQANAIANQNECCCNTRLEIANQSAGINQNLMQNRYESALSTAAINENTTAQTQKILDALAANRMADMQNEIDSLKLAQATNGVLRYPTSSVYSTPMPWWGNGQCNGGF